MTKLVFNATTGATTFDDIVTARDRVNAVSAHPAFRVRTANLPDRMSEVVKINAMHFDKSTREIRVFCDDGRTRKCKVDRLPSLDAGRTLWKYLEKVGTEQSETRFISAGGFSPDVWFYNCL